MGLCVGWLYTIGIFFGLSALRSQSIWQFNNSSKSTRFPRDSEEDFLEKGGGGEGQNKGDGYGVKGGWRRRTLLDACIIGLSWSEGLWIGRRKSHRKKKTNEWNSEYLNIWVYDIIHQVSNVIVICIWIVCWFNVASYTTMEVITATVIFRQFYNTGVRRNSRFLMTLPVTKCWHRAN